MTKLVGLAHEAVRSSCRFHDVRRPGEVAALRTTETNWVINVWSFTPGSRSTPLHTSTASGLTTRIASPTLAGVRPPSSKLKRAYPVVARALFQSHCSPPPP